MNLSFSPSTPRLLALLALMAAAATPAAANPAYLSPHLASAGARAAMARYQALYEAGQQLDQGYRRLQAEGASDEALLENRAAQLTNTNRREQALKGAIQEVSGVFMLDFLEADHDPEVLQEYWGKVQWADGAIKTRRDMFQKLQTAISARDSLAMVEFEVRITLDVLSDQLDILQAFSEWADLSAGGPPLPAATAPSPFPGIGDGL